MTNAEARFNKSHIRKVYACLAVTCHLHFWQNDRDLLRATAVRLGWNGYWHTGAGITQSLERRIRDWKVAGSNPCRSGGRILFSRVDFLRWVLFRYPFHPRVTGVARKRSRSFCQKCRWHVTAKHAYTWCGFAWSDMEHGCMVYTELAPRRQQIHVASAMSAL